MPDYRDIPGFEGIYSISESGQVKSIERVVTHSYCGSKRIPEKIRKQAIDKDGYPVLKLSKNGIKHHFGIHRLVALTWIPNPNNFSDVNHLDGVKTNSHKDNLEWTTVSGNAIHAYKHGLRKSPWTGNGSMKGRFGAAHNQAKAVIQLTMEGEFIKRYDHIRAAKKDGFQPTHIGACCKGKANHHRNFKWQYA